MTWKGEADDEGDGDEAWNGEADGPVVAICDPPARVWVGAACARERTGMDGRSCLLLYVSRGLLRFFRKALGKSSLCDDMGGTPACTHAVGVGVV